MPISLSADFLHTMNRLGRNREAFLFVIDFLGKSPQIYRPEEAEKAGILYQLPNNKQSSRQIPTMAALESLYFDKVPPSEALYYQAFEQVKAALQAGDSYLVNLSLPSAIKTNLSLEQIFWHSQAPYKLFMPQHFVCFSPEPFVKIKNGTISSFPMKGTIDAHIPNAQQILLENTKELAEHATIVDLIRNDLSQVAKKVRLKRFRYLDYIATNTKALYQMSSEITGQLPSDYRAHIGDLIAKLLPAGSISGAPKRKTLEIIQAAENYERGFYTGIFGYFDGKNLDSAVMIRFIEQETDGKLYFKSGGGITAFSQAESEYQELIDKVYLPILAKENLAPKLTLLQS